jgi:hypothetical protein
MVTTYEGHLLFNPFQTLFSFFDVSFFKDPLPIYTIFKNIETC